MVGDCRVLGEIMKGFVMNVRKLTLRGRVTKHFTCHEMDGEGGVRVEAVVPDHLPLDVHLYLCKLVGGPCRLPFALAGEHPHLVWAGG